MSNLKPTSRTILILPLVLSTVALFEQVATYVVRLRVHGAKERAIMHLVLDGVAFSIAAAWISPWLVRVVKSLSGQSERQVGLLGPLALYALAYGVVLYAYFILETRGARGLVPDALL